MTLQMIKDDAVTLGFKGNISHLNTLSRLVAQQPSEAYDLMKKFGISPDSVIREKLFTYIADKYHNGNYYRVYQSWLA